MKVVAGHTYCSTDKMLAISGINRTSYENMVHVFEILADLFRIE